MDETDMLSTLLNDPKALEQALSTASALLGGSDFNAQQMPTLSNATAEYDPSADLMRRAMPVIGRIAQYGQTAVDPQKRALLNAIKPFVGGNISTQIDHGMRLVSLARMATAILHAPQEDSDHV